MNLDSTQWYTETYAEGGSAFSFSIKAKLHEEQSAYQKIEIYDTTHFGKLMVIDDCVMLTTRDNFIYHEMLSHPALYTHPNPRQVVIVGGGDCGTLREVLHHATVTHALQVEIDERVTRLSEVHFPELCEANHDPRAELYFGDGIRWMKEAPADSVDVIIIDSTDPVGPAEGLFGESFYRDCLHALAPGGILVQQSESPLYHSQSIIKSMHQAMRCAGFSDTRSLHFPQCVYPSGWWSATLATKNGDLHAFREQAARAKSFACRYYTADMHRASLTLPAFMQVDLSAL
jgi:spermidine synthase